MAGKPVAASCRCGAVCAGFPGVARPDCLGWVAVRAGGRRPARFPMLFVACGPTGVPGAVGSGRPRDRHTRAFGSESSISKPGQALRTLRHPPHRWGFSLLCTSHPGPAAHGPRRQAPQPGLSRPAAHASPSTSAVPGVLVGDRRRFEARLCPAAASGYRSWAPAGCCMPCVGFQSGPLGGLQHEDLAGGVSPTCRVLV